MCNTQLSTLKNFSVKVFGSHLSFFRGRKEGRKEDKLNPKDLYPSLEARSEVLFSFDVDDILSSASEELACGPTDMPPPEWAGNSSIFGLYRVVCCYFKYC